MEAGGATTTKLAAGARAWEILFLTPVKKLAIAVKTSDNELLIPLLPPEEALAIQKLVKYWQVIEHLSDPLRKPKSPQFLPERFDVSHCSPA
jgi:hypothetical protein